MKQIPEGPKLIHAWPGIAHVSMRHYTVPKRLWSSLTKRRLWVLGKVQNRSACIIPCFSPINKYMCRYHKQGAGTLTPKTELMALGESFKYLNAVTIRIIQFSLLERPLHTFN